MGMFKIRLVWTVPVMDLKIATDLNDWDELMTYIRCQEAGKIVILSVNDMPVMNVEHVQVVKEGSAN